MVHMAVQGGSSFAESQLVNFKLNIRLRSSSSSRQVVSLMLAKAFTSSTSRTNGFISSIKGDNTRLGDRGRFRICLLVLDELIQVRR